ncbi:DUF885 family protein [Tunturiibacter gelidiferens]
MAAQNDLFEEIYQADLKSNPERATAVGDYRYNDKLADYSVEAIIQQNTANQANLRRLSAIDAAGFPEQDLLSHQLMERRLKQSIENFDLKNYEMSVNQQNGIHTSLRPAVGRSAGHRPALRRLHRPPPPDSSRSRPI